MDIGKFRRLLTQKFKSKNKKEILDFINKYIYVDKNAALSIYVYFQEQFLYSEVPSDKSVVIEHYYDEKNHYYVFHALFGRRVNDALSRAFAYIVSRIHHRDVELNVNDNGFYLGCDKPLKINEALKIFNESNLTDVLGLAIDKTEVLSRRFRHCAARSLMILRSYKGKQKKVGRQQVSSMLLLNAVKRISNDFPILKEARREVLEDLMDITNASMVQQKIKSGDIKIIQTDTQIPSPFAFNLIIGSYSDILRIEDKQEFLKKMHQMVLAKIALKDKNREFNYEDLLKR